MIPIVIFPSILATGGASTLSDIMFLAKKEFDGKLKKNEGFLSAAGDLATLTASSGKDLYIARAKCVFYSNTGVLANATADSVVLKINGVIIETATISWAADAGNGRDGVIAWSYSFENIGHKVAATQVIKLEVITLDADTDVEGFIECWEETTGVDPSI